MFGAIVSLSALAGSPDRLRDAVVIVQQAGGTCAGVVLDDGQVATAYHCIASGFRARVERRDGTRHVARVVATDPARDLALIQVDEPLSGGLRVGTAPEVGAPVTVIGHPHAALPPAGFLTGTLQWTVSTGHVTAVGEHALQLDATYAPGNSGGPVIDAEDQVVAIASRRVGDRIGFAGRSEWLQALRDEPRRPGLGGSWAVTPVAWLTDRPSFGLDLEVTWRERIVLGARGGLPVAPVLRAVLRGDAEATVGLARAGVRLPIGRAPGSVAVDAFAAAGVTRIWTSEDGAAPETSARLDSFVGGAIGRGIATFEVARRIGPGEGADWLFGLRLGLGALRRVW